MVRMYQVQGSWWKGFVTNAGRRGNQLTFRIEYFSLTLSFLGFEVCVDFLFSEKHPSFGRY